MLPCLLRFGTPHSLHQKTWRACGRVGLCRILWLGVLFLWLRRRVCRHLVWGKNVWLWRLLLWLLRGCGKTLAGRSLRRERLLLRLLLLRLSLIGSLLMRLPGGIHGFRVGWESEVFIKQWHDYAPISCVRGVGSI
jgi:hypothetical protein